MSRDGSAPAWPLWAAVAVMNWQLPSTAEFPLSRMPCTSTKEGEGRLVLSRQCPCSTTTTCSSSTMQGLSKLRLTDVCGWQRCLLTWNISINDTKHVARLKMGMVNLDPMIASRRRAFVVVFHVWKILYFCGLIVAGCLCALSCQHKCWSARLRYGSQGFKPQLAAWLSCSCSGARETSTVHKSFPIY